jgi:hypothetical protein
MTPQDAIQPGNPVLRPMSEVRFLRVAALCSALSAVTTLLLIFLPEFFSTTQGFEARMARVHEPAYRLRSWVYLLHPFLVLTAAFGIAATLRRHAPVLVIAGLLGFTWWAFTEASQQTLTLFAFDRWREAYATADESARAAIRINSVMYDGIWDGMYALLLIAFAIGNACFGAALIARRGLARMVGAFLLAACGLTVLLLANEVRMPLVPGELLGWSYPAIQPLGRLLIGVYLWRHSVGRSGDS